jgi:predicted nucleotidyltransferase
MASAVGGCDAPTMERSAQRLDVDAIRRAMLHVRPDGVAAIYLFGSVARGTSDDTSDVDIGVVMLRRRPPGSAASSEERAHFEKLADRIAATVAAFTGTERVDVVDLRAQGPLFTREALDGAILLFEGDRDARLDFFGETLVRALDFEPTFEIAMSNREARMRAALRRDGHVVRA